MKNKLILAWYYIRYHKVKTTILKLCITLTLYLPFATKWLIKRFDIQIGVRSEATPLVIGPKGSKFDLVQDLRSSIIKHNINTIYWNKLLLKHNI